MENVPSSCSIEKKAPKLRFPEFKGEWNEELFSDVFSFLSNNTRSRAELSNEGLVKNIHYGDILVKYRDVLSANYDTIPYVSNNIELKNPDYLKNGDIIIADTAEDETVGKATELTDVDNIKIVAGLHTMPCRPRKKFAHGYLGYYINSVAYHNKLFPYMQGIKVASISKSNISKTVVAFPAFNEQEKLSSFIEKIDRFIILQQQLINSLKSYKRGLLCGIFSEKIKITNDKWNNYRIGDFLCSKCTKQLPSEKVPLMAFTSTGGVCDKGERYDRSFLVKDTNTKMYKRTDYGDFIYSSNNLDVGSIGLNLYGSAVISDVYEIFSICNADNWFISEAIKQKPVISNILKYRQGCLYGQYRIYAEDFLSVKIKAPSLKTQTKIGKIFSCFEKKISNEEYKLELLINLKTSLLQQMFI